MNTTMKHYARQLSKDAKRHPWGLIGAGAALGAMAAIVQFQTKKAENENPPKGRFIEVDGVKLHYLDEGSGDALVLIHGNGTLADDFKISAVLDEAAKKYRVLVFDRPGYGYSDRPTSQNWNAIAQANLIQKALVQLGVKRPIVAGHSWGTLVAIAMALEHQQCVRSLVLLSGYYYPMPRIDVLLSAPMALPVLGAFLRYTISPLLGRLAWPLAKKKLFLPSEEPENFKRCFPVWMALRPSQLRASAADAALMIPEAYQLSDRYEELHIPIVIVAGSGDLLALAKLHAERLHREIAHSQMVLTPGAGHMIHHIAPDDVIKGIDMAAAAEPVDLQRAEIPKIGVVPHAA